jgi:hypothetical protein
VSRSNLGRPMQERRKQDRQPAYWAGKIAFNRRQSLLDCLVRNTSESGAKLVLEATTFVPRDFDLMILKHGAEYRAKVVWRRAEEVGVRLERVQVAIASDRVLPVRQRVEFRRDRVVLDVGAELTPMALIRRLKRLRQQNAALRRRLLAQSE